MRCAAVPALLLMLAPALAGCLDSGADATADLESLEVYRFVYPGAEKAVPGAEHGWLLRVQNPTDADISFRLGAFGVTSARLGPATDDGWRTTPAPPEDPPREAVWGGDVTLPAGGSVALLASIQSYGGGPAGLLLVAPGAVREVPVSIAPEEAGPQVRPGDHVQTVTVGVWLNGTSFYTNSRSLLDDPDFPAGGNIDIQAARGETDPLPVYVYGDDRTEQPAGSRDTCHFTTIDGYNDLLKTQVTGSTGVRWLAPEEAYTRDGAEEHFLYGDALVFLNTVVAHDGATGPADAVPDPQGACFDAQSYLPPVPPLPTATPFGP